VEGRPQELTDDARRALELLQHDGAVSVTALRSAGIGQPAQALYALQLAGWPVRRSGSSWRLVDRLEPPPPRPVPAPRVRRVSRDEDR
jgi:hypothetical protein